MQFDLFKIFKFTDLTMSFSHHIVIRGTVTKQDVHED